MRLVEIKDYFIKRKKLSIPELQAELSLSYKETHLYVENLLRVGIIKPVDELYYEIDNHRLDVPKTYVYLLYQCIKTEKSVFCLDFDAIHIPIEEMTKANQWMLENGLVKKKFSNFVDTISMEEFLLRFSEYLPFEEEAFMTPFKERARNCLWDYIEKHPDINYLEFKRYCLTKAMETKEDGPELASEFLNFLKDYDIHSQTSFELCKKQGRH